MNKFLGEQLLEFNKNEKDQYRENWGSILNFVHEDPKHLTAQFNPSPQVDHNSSVDIFQRQMLLKEQELLAEKARQDAAKRQSNTIAGATKYHFDEQERIKDLIQEVKNDGKSQLGGNVTQTNHSSNIGNHNLGGVPSEEAVYMRELSN